MADTTVVWTPLDNAIGVPYPSATIKVTFGAAIYAAYTDVDNKTAFTPTTLLYAFAIKKDDTDGETVEFTASIDATNKIVTFVPSVDLVKNQPYFLALLADAVYPSHATAQTAEDITWTTQVDVVTPTASVLNGAASVTPTLLTGDTAGNLFQLNQGDQDCFIVVNNTDGSNAASVVIKKPDDPVFWASTADRVAIPIPAGKMATIYIDSGRWCNKDYTFRMYGDGVDLYAAIFSR